MITEQERNELILEHLPYIKAVAKKYEGVADYEDLVQEGILGLIHATTKFDSSYNVKFLTYASGWIRAYMIRFGKRLTKEQATYGDSEVPNLADGWWKLSPEQVAIQNQFHTKTKQNLVEDGASEKELDVVFSRYLSDNPCTLAELGKKYGVTRERIRQIEKKMIDKIKARLEGGTPSEQKLEL